MKSSCIKRILMIIVIVILSITTAHRCGDFPTYEIHFDPINNYPGTCRWQAYIILTDSRTGFPIEGVKIGADTTDENGKVEYRDVSVIILEENESYASIKVIDLTIETEGYIRKTIEITLKDDGYETYYITLTPV